MKKAFQFTIALLACIHLAGGPYALVQLVAWGGMLVNYSQTDGLAQAAVDTFSGEKPCEMCKSIAAAKSDDVKKKAPGSQDSSAATRLAQEMLPAEIPRLKPLAATEFTATPLLAPLMVPGLGGRPPLLQPPRVA